MGSISRTIIIIIMTIIVIIISLEAHSSKLPANQADGIFQYAYMHIYIFFSFPIKHFWLFYFTVIAQV